ncbi:MAG: hypothetical protein US20_C0023G0004 [Candidatus Pacebacteria bacterium GW2011_GWF1_36_5]|nr:MAG: hypothetical protein US20_C0023G0004 [Candidatus Pacebacteria bacterium GW2011_GWF1_36_5]
MLKKLQEHNIKLLLNVSTTVMDFFKEEFREMNQFELTTAIIKNVGNYDLKDCAFKILLIFSVHYPNILINRSTLINKYGLSESSVDRGLKELREKAFILKVKDKLTLNLNTLNLQFEGNKVINLKAHEQTKLINKYNKNNFQKNEGGKYSASEQTKKLIEEKLKLVCGGPDSETKKEIDRIINKQCHPYS